MALAPYWLLPPEADPPLAEAAGCWLLRGIGLIPWRSNSEAAFDRRKSQALMKIAIRATPTNTTNADPTSSSRLGHETCFNSSRMSNKKTEARANGFAMIAKRGSKEQERQESNLQFRFWRPVVYR